MRISPQIRRLALASVITAGVGGGVLAGASLGHPDNGGPERVNDSVKVTEVTALTDQDDGFNGLSEYCIRITTSHPDHIPESESVDCVNVNWDDTDRVSGSTWEEIGSLPLIGEQGYAGTAWKSVDHTRECVKSAPWNLSVKLTESNTFGLADILNEIGKALTQQQVSGALGGKAFLYGEAAKIAGRILRELFEDLANLGEIPLDWVEGEGDTNQTIPKASPEGRHFKVAAEKTVTEIAKDCTTYSLGPGSSAGGASPLAHAAQAARCGSDQRHIFCKSVSRARGSWRRLDRASRRIARLRRERGVRGRVDVKGIRRNLIQLVASLGRYSAKTEIVEARRLSLSRRNRAALARARAKLRRGKRLQSRATRRVSVRVLRQSLRNYRAAHLRLLPITHRSFNR